MKSKYNFEKIPCHREPCDGTMIPEVREVKLNDGTTIIEVKWICQKCGSIKGGVIGSK